MNISNTDRKYIDFDPTKGYPAGIGLFYECLRCGDVLPSQPESSTQCTCKNIAIDAGYGRVHVKDQSKIRIFRKSTAKAD